MSLKKYIKIFIKFKSIFYFSSFFFFLFTFSLYFFFFFIFLQIFLQPNIAFVNWESFFIIKQFFLDKIIIIFVK